MWDLGSGKLVATATVPHHRPVTALAFSSPSGATFVAAHGEEVRHARMHARMRGASGVVWRTCTQGTAPRTLRLQVHAMMHAEPAVVVGRPAGAVFFASPQSGCRAPVKFRSGHWSTAAVTITIISAPNNLPMCAPRRACRRGRPSP